MKVTASQLRRIIKEEVKLVTEASSILDLLGVESLEDASDEDLQAIVGAYSSAKNILDSRRREYVSTTPLGQRLQPIPGDVIFSATRLTPAEAKKYGLVKFFKDGNSYYAATTTGMLWKSGPSGRLTPTGKTAADFKAARKAR